MLEKFLEGDIAEPIIIERLDQEHGWKMVDDEMMATFGTVDHTGQLLLELQAGKHKVRCHPDGDVVKMDRGDKEPAPGTVRVLEVKALGKSFLANIERNGIEGFAPYAWQASVEMLTTGLEMQYVIGSKGQGGEVDPEVPLILKHIADPPVKRVEIVRRVLDIVARAEAGEPGECEAKMFPCPHYRNGGLCGEEKKSPESEVSVISRTTEKQIVKWADLLDHAVKEKAAWSEKVGKYRGELVELLEKQGLTGTRNVRHWRVKPSFPKIGRVQWGKVAEELKDHVAEDEFEAIVEATRGKVPKASVSIERIEEWNV